MPKNFIKTRDCGCIVVSTLVGTYQIKHRKLYTIGEHKHKFICNKCERAEDNGIDTLDDMTENDIVTNDYEHAGWEELLVFK